MTAQATPTDILQSPLSLALTDRIREVIVRAGGRIGFDQFMAMALYEPGLGYYSSSRPKIGLSPESGSDFVTAPVLSPAFGWTVAAQVREGLDLLGLDEVIEFGAGTGALAVQLAQALGERLGRYRIVELSADLRARQQAVVTAKLPPELAARFEWLDAWPDRIQAVIVGNEVLDAMPVQLLHFDGQGWHERGVAWHDGQFAWADLPTTLRPPVDHAMPPGTVTEIHLQGEAFIASLADRLDRGLVLLIDYGFPEAEYYLPQRHQGTLICHLRHQVDHDPLTWVGDKDITAHVNFTGIALAAQDAGLDVVGYTSQGRFLLNCGLMKHLEGASIPAKAHAQKLFTEHEMGELFKVIALSKGLAEGDPLLGFASGDRTHML